MKKVKIFLASSVEDLREDRLQVGDFFRQLNEIYLDSGVHFSLIKCEDYDNSIAAGGKQQEYDREIRESELVFFLFFRKVGDYTRHEFEVALEAFKNQHKPKIITYFKYIASIDEASQEVRDFMQLLDLEVKHYYNTYGHIDTLKLGVLMQIKLLQLDSTQIRLEDGVVRLNGQAVVNAANVPLLYGNQSLRELTEKRQQLLSALNQRRSVYLADPTPENEAAFFDTSAELNRVSKHLTEVEQDTLALLTTVAEMTSDGRVLTHRQKDALKYFNQGDYAAVRSILEDEERENELRRAQQRAEVAKNEIQGYVEEELLLIKTEKAQGLTEERVKRILAGYQKVAELTEKHDLQKNVLYEYAAFLQNQNQFAEAIIVAEKLRWYYADPSTTVAEDKKAALYNLLGGLYHDMQRTEDAEKAFKKALGIVNGQIIKESDTYEMTLAAICNNLALLFCDTWRYEDAEELYKVSLEICTRCATQNSGVDKPDLATIYDNLGSLYHKIQRYKEAEEADGKALEIRVRLAARDPEAYERDLACSYNSLGVLYADIRHSEKAERALKNALEICTHLVERNPAAYEPDLASVYLSLGTFYKGVQRHMEAGEVLGKGLEIYSRLAVWNPDTYEPNVAQCFYMLGSLYVKMHKYREAKRAYVKAMEIRARLADQKPHTFRPDLARSYFGLSAFYIEIQRYTEAEDALMKALEIYSRLAAQNPVIFEPDLAEILWALAIVYTMQRKQEKQLAVLRRALPLFERLTKKNPDRYLDHMNTIHRILWEK